MMNEEKKREHMHKWALIDGGRLGGEVVGRGGRSVCVWI